MTVPVGGMRALNANFGQSQHGVFTKRPEALTNDFFVNLLDMDTEWKAISKDELIATDVNKDLQSHRKTAGQIPSDLLVQYVASTSILVLNWWIESRSPLPPNDINNLFRELILPTLTKWE